MDVGQPMDVGQHAMHLCNMQHMQQDVEALVAVNAGQAGSHQDQCLNPEP